MCLLLQQNLKVLSPRPGLACRDSGTIDLKLCMPFLQGLKGHLLAAVLAIPDAGLQVVDQTVQREVATGRGLASGGGQDGRRLRLDMHLSTRNKDAHNIIVHLQQVAELRGPRLTCTCNACSLAGNGPVLHCQASPSANTRGRYVCITRAAQSAALQHST